MSKYKHVLYCETADGSLYQLLFIWWWNITRITVVIQELIRALNLDSLRGEMYLLDSKANVYILVTHDNCSNRMVFIPAIDHSNFCPISFRWWGSGPPWLWRVTENEGSIPEREPERRLPHPRKAAGAQITQSWHREVVTRNNNTEPL